MSPSSNLIAALRGHISTLMTLVPLQGQEMSHLASMSLLADRLASQITRNWGEHAKPGDFIVMDETLPFSASDLKQRLDELESRFDGPRVGGSYKFSPPCPPGTIRALKFYPRHGTSRFPSWETVTFDDVAASLQNPAYGIHSCQRSHADDMQFSFVVTTEGVR